MRLGYFKIGVPSAEREIGEHEPVALHDHTGLDAESGRKHRPGVRAGVKLTTLGTRSTPAGKSARSCASNSRPAKERSSMLRIQTRDAGAKTVGDHRLRK